MGLIIPQYRAPGAYSTIIPQQTTASASGPPIVAILGQALQGPYTPQLFFNSDDSQNMYGVATKSNPLSLGIQIAFENHASQVLGINVEPTNSYAAYYTVPNSGLPGVPVAGNTSTFPTSSFLPAATGLTGLLDPISQQPVNTDGTVAGVFYIQDFDPQVADPVLNSSPQSTQSAFGLSSNSNLLQYIKYGKAPISNGQQQVPLANTNMVRILVPANQITAAPVSGTFGQISQSKWNQLQNAFTLVNAINSTPNSPAISSILVPDASQTAYAPYPGWREMYSSVGHTITYNTNTYPITSVTDAYAFACTAGVFSLFAIEPGSQHEIVMGLFAASTFDVGGTLPFGLQVTGFAGVSSTNPFIIFDNGVDGVITSQSYITAINTVLTAVRADLLVVLNTDSTLQQVIQDHCDFMSSEDERNERIAFVSGPINEVYTTSIANVQAIQTGASPDRMVYIWPTGGFRQDPILRTQVTLDGTFIGCACAGYLASKDAATPLTRAKIKGFTDVITHVSRTSMNSIAQNGITIIENHPTAGLRVRDGITCDPTNADTQEISVVRQLDYVAQQVRDLLDLNIVATKIVQGTLAAVQTMTKNILQQLVTSQIIADFANVSARINPVEPRQIDVRFSVQPAYPCKYVQITISVVSSLIGQNTSGVSTPTTNAG